MISGWKVLLLTPFLTTHNEAIQAYYGHPMSGNYKQWADKIWEEIGPLDTYAEGPFVELNLIPRFFNTSCCLLQAKNDSIITQDLCDPDNNPSFAFYILLDGEHYNIVYPRAHWHRMEVRSVPDRILEGGEEDPVNCPYPPSPSPLPSNHLSRIFSPNQEDWTLAFHDSGD